MKRILFIDDEPRLLVAVQLMLEDQRGVWDVRVARGGEAGLVALAGASFDAVVCDLQMPRMDGISVLAAVRRQQPAALRLILADAKDVAGSVSAMHVAHQFLPKPCPKEVLVAALTRALSVQEQLGSAQLQPIVCGRAALPSPPRVFQMLSAALADPEVDLNIVADTVREEPALSAKVLQMVNSSCFGLGRPLANVREAVTFLGLRTLKQLVLGAEVYGGAETARLATGCNLEAEQERAVTIARIAAEIVAPDPTVGELAFTAALLHDVGELVLAGHLPDDYARTKAVIRARRAGESPAPGDAAQLDLHARVGAYLAGIWGLPEPVVQGVWHHHEPGRLGSDSLHVAGIVHVADALYHVLRTGSDEQEQARVLERMLDREWLAAAGHGDHLEAWCERTRAFGAELSAVATAG